MGKYWSSGLAVLYDPLEFKTWEGRVGRFSCPLICWKELNKSGVSSQCSICMAVKWGVFTVFLFCIWLRVLRIVGSTLSLTLWRCDVTTSQLNSRWRRPSRQYFGFWSLRAATALHVSKKNITFSFNQG